MNKSLKTLFLYNGIFIFASYLFSPLYALFAEGIVKNVFSISLTISALLISTTFFTLLISKFGDRVKEKEYLLMGGYLVRAISWISLIFVNSMGALITIQILLGLGESLGSSAFSAIFAEHLDRNKHVKEYASWHLVSTLLGAASTLIGGLIVSIFGFNILFITMSLLAMASFIGVVVKPRKLL
jgi:MFS family permease